MLLTTTSVTVVRAAANPGTPNNERLTVKRLVLLNVLAPGGQTVSVSLWRGTTQDSAHQFKNNVPLAPQEGLEFDPTTMVLAPGDSIWAQASVANAISIQGDGLRQTE